VLRVLRFVVGVLDTNCYLVYDEDSREAALVDPGDVDEDICRWVKRLDLSVKYILATHGHFDHIMGIPYFKKKFGALFAMNPRDLDVARISWRWGRGIAPDTPSEEPPVHDVPLGEGDVIYVGGHALVVLETPGHTPGSVAFYALGSKIVFTGDTLFSGTVGRTDLPGGSSESLVKSLCKLFSRLPGDALVYPGHGPETTIAKERRLNIFVEEALRFCGDVT